MPGESKIADARRILAGLGLPGAQRNERSALCLLALLDLGPRKPWSKAGNPLIGVTPIMDFAREQYGKQYAPNTRETFRRHTLHQFVAAGIALHNPGEPGRAVNSPKVVYQIEPATLALLRGFGSAHWDENVERYLAMQPRLAARYAAEREMKKLPVTLSGAGVLKISRGAHSALIRAIIEDFAPRFVPGGIVVYVGDTGKKWIHFDRERLAGLGVTLDRHGKMPDVVLHDEARGWLVLVECVTSHGPVNAKRHEELAMLFAASTAGLVYLTAFPSRTAMARHLGEIAWETEVWCADSPPHLVHFNGPRFLGPYP